MLPLAWSLSEIVMPASAASIISSARIASGLIRKRRPLALPVVRRLSHREVRCLQRLAQDRPGMRVRVDQKDGLAPVAEADIHGATVCLRRRGSGR